MSAKIDWMGGRVPASWRVFKLKHVLREERKEIGSDAPAGAISFGEVVYKDFDNDETLATYRTVRRGQFLINPLNLNYDLKSLRIGLSEIDCRVSPAYIVASNDERIAKAKYLRWALRVFDVQHIKTLGAGVRQTVRFEDIGACLIALPSPDDQEIIASHLDLVTTRIDALVAKKTRFIELLREKRQALITHAVTKGLDPSVPMKDSGVDWLGNVPAHWKIRRLRYVTTFNPSPNWDALLQQQMEYPFIPMEAISETGDLNCSGRKTISEARGGYSYFSEGDVTYAKVTPCFENGKGAVIRGLEGGHGFGTTELTVMRPRKIEGQFLYALTCAQCFRGPGAAEMLGTGGLKRVPEDFARDFRAAIPPSKEQSLICFYIDRSTSRIDGLIAKTERSIELLREHRTALITAAVTGKIDLRDAA